MGGNEKISDISIRNWVGKAHSACKPPTEWEAPEGTPVPTTLPDLSVLTGDACRRVTGAFAFAAPLIMLSFF